MANRMESRLFTSPHPPSSRIHVHSYVPFSFLKIPDYHNNNFVMDDNTTIVVSVDGACSGNGRIDAQAGIGAFFGPHSCFNISEPVTSGAQTNQRAEIIAAIRALEVASGHGYVQQYVNKIVVISDSEYVVKAMTSYVFQWRQNGWLSATRRPVVNMYDLKRLDDLIEEVKKDHQLDVKFWLVGREYNSDADSLAKRGIYRIQ